MAKTIRDEIYDALQTQQARDYWHGMASSYENEFVDIALADSVADAAAAVEAAAIPLTREDRLMLGKITTRDEAGSHFTAIYAADWLDRMEARGYIAIDRPIHEATRIPYDSQYWSVEVDPVVAYWFGTKGGLEEFLDD